MRYFAFLVAIFALVAPAQAGFVFTIGTVTGLAGNTFDVPVTVTSTNGTQFGVNGGFNLGIDAAPAGAGLPSGIAFNASPISGSIYFANPTLNTAFNVVFGIDGIGNSNSSSGLPLPNNIATTVVNLRFNVAGSVAPGSYAINFSSNALTSVTDSNGTPLTLGSADGYTLNGGAITVVPEPSSLALAGLVAVCATGYVRRSKFRRKKLAV